jgi:hypothetical protein
MVNLIKNIHNDSNAKVRSTSVFSTSFKLVRGLKQGSVFAPKLFNIFFGAIIKQIHKRLGPDRHGIKLKYNIRCDIFNKGELKSKSNNYISV